MLLLFSIMICDSVLSGVQMVIDVAYETNALSWPWHLEQSGARLLAMDTAAALTAATIKSGIKSPIRLDNQTHR